MHGEWLDVSDSQMETWEADGMTDMVGEIRDRIELQRTNPLACFLPHGVPRREEDLVVGETDFVIPASEYPEKYANDGVAFLNDYTSDMSVILAGNQCGKSSILSAWTALRLVPCEKNWPIFTENGVEWHEWGGPKSWVVASYNWQNVETFWGRIREFFPHEELGEYAPGGKKNLNFGDGRTKRLTLLCGSELMFLAYSQAQAAWEGFSTSGGSFDEQISREKYIGWVRGTTTKGDWTPCAFAMTGHVLPEMPNTGAAGWIKTDLWDGDNRGGNKVSFYHLGIDSAPDAIISPKKKKELWSRWVDPSQARSRKEQREAIARYHGGWEEGSGMVFDTDVYQRKTHVIHPLWPDDNVPNNLTLWRAIDYGSAKGYNVCLWLAVDQSNNAFVYRSIYESRLEIAEFVQMIIERSHNDRTEIGQYKDEVTGNIYQMFEEVQKKEVYYGGTILDPRSAAQAQQGQTLEEIFCRYGLRDIRPGCGQRDDIQIPRLLDHMRIDWTREHIVTKEKGCPSLFFFDGETTELTREIERARLPDEGRTGMIHHKDAQHGIDALKYVISDSPRYMGDTYSEPDYNEESPRGSLFTGYGS
jgi:hypothetical protein